MKLSMIMPIYNEAKLLPSHLEMAAPHLDEIILIDGSPEGPSTDKTKDLIEASGFDNVKRIEGKFELHDRKGGWDKINQIRAGVEQASGELLIITSCDSVYGDYAKLAEALNRFPDGKVFYCHTREFFIDTEHIRLIPQNSFPLPQLGYPIIWKRLFTPQHHSLFGQDLVEHWEYIYLYDIDRFHYGWITDFDVQVKKHIRNVCLGAWGEYGENILVGGDRTLEAWAITHTLNYTKEPKYLYAGNGHHPFQGMEFSYLNKFDEVIKAFQEKHGKSYYDCV